MKHFEICVLISIHASIHIYIYIISILIHLHLPIYRYQLKMNAGKYLSQQKGCPLGHWRHPKHQYVAGPSLDIWSPHAGGRPLQAITMVFACIRSGMSTLCMQRGKVCLPAEEEITEARLESQLTAGFAQEFGYQEPEIKLLWLVVCCFNVPKQLGRKPLKAVFEDKNSNGSVLLIICYEDVHCVWHLLNRFSLRYRSTRYVIEWYWLEATWRALHACRTGGTPEWIVTLRSHMPPTKVRAKTNLCRGQRRAGRD